MKNDEKKTPFSEKIQEKNRKIIAYLRERLRTTSQHVSRGAKEIARAFRSRFRWPDDKTK